MGIGLFLASGVSAQVELAPTPSDSVVISDTTALDSLALDSIALMTLTQPPQDTVRSNFVPPHLWRRGSRWQADELLAGPAWPMPRVPDVAGGDFADWLSYHPAYDVNDAPGVGQTRFFTKWGAVDRSGDWQVEGRPVTWQRLTFPMTPQFDPAIIPSFSFAQTHVGEGVILRNDTLWGDQPVFDYTFRLGDFADAYSEGYFRAHTRRGFGLQLGGVFFSSDGRYASDNRDKRNISLETFGPLSEDHYWRVHYNQFRDKSLVVPPEPYNRSRPQRNDLLWSAEAVVAHIADSVPRWQIGARIKSGDQRLKDPTYSVASDDHDGQVFMETQIIGWDLNLQLGLKQLEMDSIDVDAWYANAALSKLWQFGKWTAALEVSASDDDNNPPAPAATAALAPRSTGGLRPSLRLSRQRSTPTLFDRYRPYAEFSVIDAGQEGLVYSEAGDPSLDDQWENSIGLHWGADAFSDTVAFAWTLAGHAAYIEEYTIWQGEEGTDTLLGNPVRHVRYRPRSHDARSLGAAAGIHGRLFWKIHYRTHYALKYAVDLNDVKLKGYHPHKGLAMVSLIAPRWRYGVNLRLNAAGLWWYGDTRIDPSGYESSHVLRFDLSGSAEVVNDLTIYALLQNVANFPYRTGAGQEFTGRTVRFGLHVTLFD